MIHRASSLQKTLEARKSLSERTTSERLKDVVRPHDKLQARWVAFGWIPSSSPSNKGYHPSYHPARQDRRQSLNVIIVIEEARLEREAETRDIYPKVKVDQEARSNLLASMNVSQTCATTIP